MGLYSLVFCLLLAATNFYGSIECYAANARPIATGDTVIVGSGGSTYHGTIIENKKQGVWKVLNKQGQLIEAMYYEEDTLLTTIDIADFDLKKFRLHSIEVSLPTEWDIILDTAGALVFASKPHFKDSVSKPRIVVAKLDIEPDSMNFRELMEETKRTYKADFPSIILVDETAFQSNGLDLYGISFVVNFKGEKCWLNDFLIDGGNRYYSVTTLTMGEVSNAMKYDGVFAEIVRSFSVIR